MSRNAVLQAMQEQLARSSRLAGSAWEGAKTGAEASYRAGAGLVGAPQGPSSRGSFRTTGNFRPGVDPALMSAIESAAIKNGYRVEAYSGKNPRSTGTTNHPSGRATDIRIMDPVTGKALGGVDSPHMNPGLFRKYEAFANDVHNEFVAANPTRANQFRWGGYFVQGTPMDLMHFDVSGGNMAAGNFKKGLSPQYAKMWGVPGTSPVSAGYAGAGIGNPQVAAQQKQLNALGAGLKEDGIMGPLTRAAMAKYSPYTAPSAQAYTSKASIQSPALQAATRQVQATPTARIPQARPQSPYLNSTGGAFTSDRQDLGTGVAAPPSMNIRNMRVPTQTIPGSQVAPVGSVVGAFNRPMGAGLSSPYVQPAAAPQVPTARIPQARPQSPYLNSTGGTNALAARIPQARPAYPPPSVATAEPTMYQQMVDQARRYAAVVGQVADRAANAYSQGVSRNAGNSYSGGNYSGGSYGGAGGRSLTSGVGGAFRNR